MWYAGCTNKVLGPFCLTRAIARARVGTRVNQITRAFNRTREQQNDTTLML